MPSANPYRRPVSIRLFLADGTPDGLRIVEKSNWSGLAVMCARAQYPSVRDREEFGRPGVYLFLGPSPSGTNRQTVYIGQADFAQDRLDNHLRHKEFWTHLILFSSKDTNLNKAHVQYLESRLIEIASRAKRVDLDNGNAPRLPALSEADRADVDAFLDDMLTIYPILGVGAFEVVDEQTTPTGPRLTLRGPEAIGYGRDTPEGFVVYQGSTARLDSVRSIHDYLSEQRQELIAAGVLEQRGEGLVLTQDYRFNSPSTAAGVLLGRSANGRTEWKDERGRTLKQLQEAALTAPSAPSGAKQ